jgi:hypothetical protein
MGRKRSPERDKSMQRYLDSDGKISTKELAQLAAVPEARIRKWKSEDEWEEALKNKPRKRGGQKGNKNAAVKKPSMKGNRNAVTHGAFAAINDDDIPEDALEQIEKNKNAATRMNEELIALLKRQAYLEGLLEEYEEAAKQDKFYADKVVHMIVPKSMDDIAEEKDMGVTRDCKDPDPQGKYPETMKTAMKSIVKSSAFDRRQKVEAELNRVHGRILKLLDSMKSYELENKRISIEAERLELTRARLTGAFDVEEGTNDAEEVVIDNIDDEDV